MGYDLLIYSLGNRDLQWVCEKPDTSRFLTPVTHQDYDSNGASGTDFQLPVSPPTEYWEELPREKVPEHQRRGLAMPILTRTLQRWYQFQPGSANARYLLLINTNRSGFRTLESRLSGETKKEFNRVKSHLFKEPLWTSAFLKDRGKDLLQSLADVDTMSNPAWHGMGLLELGVLGFWPESQLEKQPGLLDFNHRDSLYPYLSRLFLEEGTPELSMQSGRGTVEKSLRDWVLHADHLAFSASTGMPIVNQVLQAIIGACRQLAPSASAQSLTLVPQPERDATNPGAIQTYFPYETFLEARRTLLELYRKWEFHTAGAYLDSLPAQLRDLPAFAPHRELTQWVEDVLNHVSGNGAQVPDLVQNAGMDAALYLNPVFQIQARVVHSLVKKRFLEACTALITLRDVVAQGLLEQLFPGLVDKEGLLDRQKLIDLNLPMDKLPPPNTMAAINLRTLRALRNASMGMEPQEKGMIWLAQFFDDLNPIRKIRNNLVHRADVSKKDYRLELLTHLYNGKLDHYQQKPEAVLWLNQKNQFARESGLENWFPKVDGFWSWMEALAIRAATKLAIADLAPMPGRVTQ